MEIRRINTLAFAISGKKEAAIEKGFRKRGLFGLFSRKRKEVRKGYFPVVAYKVVRPVQAHKGISRQTVYEKKENVFYVNLNSGELYYYSGGQLHSYEVLNIVKDMRVETLRVLGAIISSGETFKDDLPQDNLLELWRAGLVKIYKPMMTELVTTVADEIAAKSDDGKHFKHTLVKERVDRNFHLPKYDDPGYDLTKSIKTIDHMAESYVKEPIKCSVDHYASLLKYIFESEATVQGVYFLPYISCSSEKGGKGKKDCVSKNYYPLCAVNEQCPIVEDVEITPIALSTEVGAINAVPVERETIDFKSVAGLEDVKKEIREGIIYPILRPELAKEYHRKGGGGILLYGPPGCGKTHIAKATIGECGAAFYNINISDLVKKGFEEAAKSLHEIFEEAGKNAPAIIFFDELDAVGGKRELKQSQTERMLIDQLLTEMDGVESTSQNVLFIGATNTPWSIDPALRRSERFTRQLFIPPPDKEARLELLGIHTKKEPIDGEINFKKLSELTEGYSSADIKALCDDASKIPWEEALEKGIERKIGMKDFISALKKRTSSLIPWYKTAYRALVDSGEQEIYREFSKYIMKYAGGVDATTKSGITFRDVGNLEDAKEEIRLSVIYPMIRQDLARQFGQISGGGILLYGPPGCGKTYLAKATAGECNAAFFNVTITDILSSEKGETEKKIREVFERARVNAPSILFFDEVDAIAGRRDGLKIEEIRLVDEFLTELDGFIKTKDVVVIAATNTPWAIDPALRRSERFTKQIFVGPPNVEAREEVFRIHCRNKPVGEDVDFEELAKNTENYTGADIQAICEAAAEIPWSEAIKGGAERKICMHDFINATKKIGSSLSPWVAAAKKDIEKSGEVEVYGELYDFLTKYTVPKPKSFKDMIKEELGVLSNVDGELAVLEEQRRELAEKIKFAQHKYYKREISEESFKHILEEFEKELIELDLRINKRKTSQN